MNEKEKWKEVGGTIDKKKSIEIKWIITLDDYTSWSIVFLELSYHWQIMS